MNWPMLLAAAITTAARAASAEPSRSASGDSCTLARPEFVSAKRAERKVFAYNTKAPLNLHTVLESTKNGVEVSRISFDSPGGGKATGLLFVPATRSSLRPSLILQHGMPSNARELAPLAQIFAQHGAVVIALDAPFARRTGAPINFTPRDSAEQIQLIRDLQRAVDILRARVNVDPNRIAYLGVSYGGAMGSLFAGVETRVKTFVLTVGDGGLVSHFTGPEDRTGIFAAQSCATRVRWLRAMTPIEPIRFIGLAAPAELLLQSGRTDILVPPADARALQNAASQPKTIKWYDAGHGLNAAALRDQLSWLYERIGLDRPDHVPESGLSDSRIIPNSSARVDRAP